MASIAPLGIYRAFDDNGEPLAGGLLYTYEAGTDTPKVTYTTAAGDIENDFPVELDSAGYAQVWLGDGGYKFVLKDADGVTLFTTDDIGGTSSAAFGAEVNEIDSNTSITEAYANSVNICTLSPTLSLLPAASAGEGFYFSVKNEGSGTVTIDPDAGELIDGASTATIPAGYSALVITDGTQWYTLFQTPAIQDATTTVKGIVELATTAEAAAGTDSTRAVTSNGLALSKSQMLQNSQSADYTLVIGDAGKQIYHPVGDANNRTFTIPANASVAFEVGTMITFTNMATANTVAIAITSDTLVLAGAGTTGTRTLAAYGTATIQKTTTTEWLVSGTGLS